jgi:hypothetical protein
VPFFESVEVASSKAKEIGGEKHDFLECQYKLLVGKSPRARGGLSVLTAQRGFTGIGSTSFCGAGTDDILQQRHWKLVPRMQMPVVVRYCGTFHAARCHLRGDLPRSVQRLHPSVSVPVPRPRPLPNASATSPLVCQAFFSLETSTGVTLE